MKQKKGTHLNPLIKDSSHTLGTTSTERKAILEKLTSLEILLKKKDDKPLTFKEGCSYLGYAPSYLYKLTYKNVIPHYKPTGKMIFFSKNELDEWIYKSGKCETENVKSETECGSNELTTKDPNQEDLFEKPEDKEIVIEFPLKSRKGQ